MQGVKAIAIGSTSGRTSQGSGSIAIGFESGLISQGVNAVAVGIGAARTFQRSGSIALGYEAASYSQGFNAVAIGNTSGRTNQQSGAIAIGFSAGLSGQGTNAIAIGVDTGDSNQGSGAIAIGFSAGLSGQGTNAIAIGSAAGQTNQPANSIILNASGTAFASATASAFYVRPIATHTTSSTLSLLMYDTTTFEVCRSTAAGSVNTKTFIVDHPIYENKHLVHACLEGPEAGVYYRGKGEITNNKYTIIKLPEYVEKLAKDFTIQITPIYTGKRYDDKTSDEISLSPSNLYTSEIENGIFVVYGRNAKFYWLVFGKRLDIVVEPDKTEVKVKGDGPYKWIEH